MDFIFTLAFLAVIGAYAVFWFTGVRREYRGLDLQGFWRWVKSAFVNDDPEASK